MSATPIQSKQVLCSEEEMLYRAHREEFHTLAREIDRCQIPKNFWRLLSASLIQEKPTHALAEKHSSPEEEMYSILSKQWANLDSRHGDAKKNEVIKSCVIMLQFLSRNQEQINCLRKFRNENPKAYDKIIPKAFHSDILGFLTDSYSDVDEKYWAAVKQKEMEHRECDNASLQNKGMTFVGYTNSEIEKREGNRNFASSSSSASPSDSFPASQQTSGNSRHFLASPIPLSAATSSGSSKAISDGHHSKTHLLRSRSDMSVIPLSLRNQALPYLNQCLEHLGKEMPDLKKPLKELGNPELHAINPDTGNREKLLEKVVELLIDCPSRERFQLHLILESKLELNESEKKHLLQKIRDSKADRLKPYTKKQLEVLGKSKIDDVSPHTQSRTALLESLSQCIIDADPEDRFQIYLIFISKFQLKKIENTQLITNIVHRVEFADCHRVHYTTDKHAWLLPADAKEPSVKQKVPKGSQLIPSYETLDPTSQQEMDRFLADIGKKVSLRKTDEAIRQGVLHQGLEAVKKCPKEKRLPMYIAMISKFEITKSEHQRLIRALKEFEKEELLKNPSRLSIDYSRIEYTSETEAWVHKTNHPSMRIAHYRDLPKDDFFRRRVDEFSFKTSTLDEVASQHKPSEAIRSTLLDRLFQSLIDFSQEDRFEVYLLCITKFELTKLEHETLTRHLKAFENQELQKDDRSEPINYDRIIYVSDTEAWITEEEQMDETGQVIQLSKKIPRYSELSEHNPNVQEVNDFLAMMIKSEFEIDPKKRMSRYA